MRGINSFRLRLALLSTLLSGLVLLAFALFIGVDTRRVSLQRIDSQADELGHGLLHEFSIQQDWVQALIALERLREGTEIPAAAALVVDPEGMLVAQTVNWPMTLRPEDIQALRRNTTKTSAVEQYRMPTDTEQQPYPPPYRDQQSSENTGDRPPRPFRNQQDAQSTGSFPPPPPHMRQQGTQASNNYPPPRTGNPQGMQPNGSFPPPPPTQQQPAGIFDPQANSTNMRPGPPRRVQPGETFTHHDNSVDWRIRILETPMMTVAVGVDLAAFAEEQQRMRYGLILAGLLGLVIIAAGSFWLARRALRPVEALIAATEKISAQALDARIPLEQTDDEFQRLITVYNDMLERLERSFHQARRFSADAAHELKTPLTILQGSLEEAVQDAASGSEEQKRYGELIEEVQRLKAIVRKLLLLSSADAGQLLVAKQPVDFTQLAKNICEDAEVLAPKLKLETRIATGITVQGDHDLLRQVLANLVKNAITHNIPNGKIWIKLKQKGDKVVFTVWNTCRPIPAEDRERIFERFYRVDKAHSRRQGGAGLGLSLSREIARAHGGRLSLEDSEATLAQFRFVLPLG